MIIYLVIDNYGWVQHQKAKILQKLNYKFNIITIGNLEKKLNANKIEIAESFFYVFSWRMLNNLSDEKILKIKSRCILGITSHYNLGFTLNDNSAFKKNSSKRKDQKGNLKFISNFKVITVNSKILYKSLRNKVTSKIYFIPNGVDTNIFSLKKKINLNNKIRLGWTGKLKEAKNISLIYKISNKLKENFEVIIKSKNKNSNYFNFFFNTNKIDFKEQLEFYRKIDFYLCTSWHEGTPNPCLEAMSCGVPVISTKVGNMPEIITNNKNGYLIDPNIKSLEKALQKIKNIKTNKYKQMSLINKKIIRDKWNYKIFLKSFDNMFKNEFNY
jgi:glycosyltransferase involved in cell wall biosynthesis